MATQQQSVINADSNQVQALPFDLDQSSVKNWLETLPAVGRLDACKTVFAALHKLNQCGPETKIHFTILEILRETVFLQSAHLASNRSHAIDSNSRKVAKLAAKIHSELASGYQRIANYHDFSESCSTQEQATIVDRATQSLGMSMLRITQMYEAPSSKVWRLLKTLYIDAEDKNLLNIRVSDPLSGPAVTTSIAESFAKIVAFNLCNPYRYSHREMQKLFKFCHEQRHQMEWLAPDSTQNHSVFAVNLADSLVPQHRSSVTDTANKSLRLIDMSKFAAELSAAASNADGAGFHLNEPMTTCLVHHLDKPIPVKINRLGMDAVIALGLESITETMQTQSGKPTDEPQAATADWLATTDLELLPLADHHTGGMSGRLARSVQQETAGGPPSSRRQERIRQQPIFSKIGSNRIDCEVHESNISNHCLVEATVDTLVIGQIVAIQISRMQVQIGVIRWLQPATNEHYFYYGVERLATQCSLANIFVSAVKLSDVLLIEKSDEGVNSHRIILPPSRYQCGTRITVQQPGTTKNFVLEKLLESSVYFCHYSLREYRDSPAG